MASWELAEWKGVARQGELPVREVGCCRKDDDCRELAAVGLKWLKNTFEKDDNVLNGGGEIGERERLSIYLSTKYHSRQIRCSRQSAVERQGDLKVHSWHC